MNENLIIGKGLTNVSFGILESDLIELLGAPSEIVSEIYDVKEYKYVEKGISFSFTKEDFNKLTSIEISKKGFEIKGVSLIGKYLHEVVHLLKSLGFGNSELESINNEVEKNHLLLFFSDESLTISFINYKCDSFSIGPLWKNDNEIIWP